MKLWAISDLHLGYAANRDALAALQARPEDWVICAGDVGETVEQLRLALSALAARFAQVIWVPGNHELWTHAADELKLTGEARYRALIDIARQYGAITPEDPYPKFGDHTLVPLFIAYDFSFAPPEVSDVQAWAAEDGIHVADDRFWRTDPYPNLAAWCAERLAYSRRRLAEVEGPTVLINHYPLRRDLIRLDRIPRFVPWCGTRATKDWHQRYRATVCVHGHLHMRATDWRDGVRFEEVAVGYPRHWRAEKGWDAYLREILPAADAKAPPGGHAGPQWHW
ncbi:MAG: metallophosphoesterase [Myxococcales bacterium]|nr:metallophosphoesterase [Myxococcales bacterium]